MVSTKTREMAQSYETMITWLSYHHFSPSLPIEIQNQNHEKITGENKLINKISIKLSSQPISSLMMCLVKIPSDTKPSRTCPGTNFTKAKS